MLREFRQELQRVEEVSVLTEVLGVLDVEQHLPLERLVADLLQRQRRPSDVLGE